MALWRSRCLPRSRGSRAIALTPHASSSRMEELRSMMMATLNIKNLPDALYKKLQARAKRERRSVAQEVTHLLSEAIEASKPLSILELRALGKEHWQGLDATAPAQRERDGWR